MQTLKSPRPIRVSGDDRRRTFRGPAGDERAGSGRAGFQKTTTRRSKRIIHGRPRTGPCETIGESGRSHVETLEQVADVVASVARRRGRPCGGPGGSRLIIRANRRRGVEEMVDRRERGQAELTLEELE